jgi:hypothetical protein
MLPDHLTTKKEATELQYNQRVIFPVTLLIISVRIALPKLSFPNEILEQIAQIKNQNYLID